MKKELLESKWTFTAGLLLAFPAVYFVLANVLNSGAGVDWLWKPIEPIFDKPSNKQFGWNINLLIVFGPVLAILLNAWSLLRIKIDVSGYYFRLEFSVKRKWWNIALVLLAGAALFCLTAYLFFENLTALDLSNNLHNGLAILVGHQII